MVVLSFSVEDFGYYSFDKLKNKVDTFELFFLQNICEKHNLSPQEVLKKYNVNDKHWNNIAERIEKSKKDGVITSNLMS